MTIVLRQIRQRSEARKLKSALAKRGNRERSTVGRPQMYDRGSLGREGSDDGRT
jgi:hypothetical protein